MENFFDTTAITTIKSIQSLLSLPLFVFDKKHRVEFLHTWQDVHYCFQLLCKNNIKTPSAFEHEILSALTDIHNNHKSRHQVQTSTSEIANYLGLNVRNDSSRIHSAIKRLNETYYTLTWNERYQISNSTSNTQQFKLLQLDNPQNSSKIISMKLHPMLYLRTSKYEINDQASSLAKRLLHILSIQNYEKPRKEMNITDLSNMLPLHNLNKSNRIKTLQKALNELVALKQITNYQCLPRFDSLFVTLSVVE